MLLVFQGDAGMVVPLRVLATTSGGGAPHVRPDREFSSSSPLHTKRNVIKHPYFVAPYDIKHPCFPGSHDNPGPGVGGASTLPEAEVVLRTALYLEHAARLWWDRPDVRSHRGHQQRAYSRTPDLRLLF